MDRVFKDIDTRHPVFLKPKGLGQASPGQRPGFQRKNGEALKGRDHAGAPRYTPPWSRPFRAESFFCIVPRALPWAGLFQPFGLPEMETHPNG